MLYGSGSIERVIVSTFLFLIFVIAGCTSSAAIPTVPSNQASAEAGSGTPLADDIAKGAAIWAQKPCRSCHGDKAQGGAGPRLTGTKLSFEQFKRQVRTPRTTMPAYNENQVSDADLQSIHKWLASLKP